MSIPQYPHEILPKQNWREGVLSSEIIGFCQDAMLGHMLNGRPEECFDFSLGEDMLSILPEKLPLNRIPGLSCSLLGTSFIVEHFHFLPSNDGKAPWHDGIVVPEEIELIGPSVVSHPVNVKPNLTRDSKVILSFIVYAVGLLEELL